jgi:hypothetical protein
MRFLVLLLLALACAACAQPPPLPPALNLTSELQGDPRDQSVRGLTTDLYFQRFTGNYPAHWPQEFTLPQDCLLNHGGGISQLGGDMAFYLSATGVMVGSKQQVIRKLLAGLEAPEKKRGKLKPAEPATHFPRQWVQQVEFRTYTDSGELAIRVVDELKNKPGLCLFQVSLPRSPMPVAGERWMQGR